MPTKKTKKQIAAEKKCAEAGHVWNYGDEDGMGGSVVTLDDGTEKVQCGRCSIWGKLSVEPITPASLKTVGWEKQCAEWRDIEAEMYSKDPDVTPWEVTFEQQRRMNERGERPMSPQEINEELIEHWIEDHLETDFGMKFAVQRRRR